MAPVFVSLFLDIDEMDFLKYSVKLSQMRACFMDDALMSVYVFEATSSQKANLSVHGGRGKVLLKSYVLRCICLLQ